MKTLYYTSKTLFLESQELFDAQAEFVVIVPEGHKKKPLVIKELDHLLYGRDVIGSKFGRLMNTFRLKGLWEIIAFPLGGNGYKIHYEDKGDLVITFTPPAKEEETAEKEETQP